MTSEAKNGWKCVDCEHYTYDDYYKFDNEYSFIHFDISNNLIYESAKEFQENIGLDIFGDDEVLSVPPTTPIKQQSILCVPDNEPMQEVWLDEEKGCNMRDEDVPLNENICSQRFLMNVGFYLVANIPLFVAAFGLLGVGSRFTAQNS